LEVFPLKKLSRPRPPAGLSAEAKRWWGKLAETFVFDDHQLMLLEELVRTLDRLREAQKLIAEHGAVFKDRWGQLRPNPACVVERDSRAALVRLLEALRLDGEVGFKR
jgi:P27 family predicted phage terminase small subunit